MMISVIVFFTFLVIVASAVYIAGASVYGLLVAPLKLQFKLYKGVTQEHKTILLQKFPFYGKLSSQYKIEFEKRLCYFLSNKEFVSRGMEITEEMKTLIGASAVQLTFGFRPLRFPHFPKILLFPHVFSTKQSSKKRKGEVNSNGLIVLSWEDFINDYKTEHDGYNLGLHEMAHALKIEDAFDDEEYHFLDEAALLDFYRVSEQEFKNIRAKKSSFLRSYGGTNREEFFAVAVEQFFEQPREFSQQLPQIYEVLTRLLRQNPVENTIQTN